MIHRLSYWLLGVLALTACASTVRVRVNDDGPEMREVQKMDCGAYDARGDAMLTGLDFGVLFGIVRGAPYAERARIASMNWDRSVHHMVGQYKELCSRFNSGGISQAAYDTRVAEIDQLWAEAQGIRQSAEEIIRGHGQASFGELERSTADTASSGEEGRQSIASAIDALVSKLGAR
jgi:hypothetical protein